MPDTASDTGRVGVRAISGFAASRVVSAVARAPAGGMTAAAAPTHRKDVRHGSL